MDNETSNANIIVSFDGVKMKDFRAYWDAARRGDWKGQDVFFAKVVKSWPYALDPSDPVAYGELELGQYTAVQAAIKEVSTCTGIVLARSMQGQVESK